MDKLGNTSFAEACRVAEQVGWRFHHATGSHWIYRKEGSSGHLSIPRHQELRPGTLRDLIATLGISVDEFNRLKR